MKYLVTGAGQIGSQLTHDLVDAGHDVVVLRRRQVDVGGVQVLGGDVLDRDLLATAMDGVGAVFHCIHTAYDAKQWEQVLPTRELAVMDAAADAGVPVVFPESVYGFGEQSVDLSEGAELAPISPLGEVRARLLKARKEHRARTISVVASDLWGPTAAPKTSVAHLSVLVPRPQNKRGFAMGNPTMPHTLTFIPDLTRAMAYAADHASEVAPEGDAILHAPSQDTGSLEDFNRTVSGRVGVRHKKLVRIPRALLAAAGRINPMMAELRNQAYLWDRPAILRSGVLTEEHGLNPTDVGASLKRTLA